MKNDYDFSLDRIEVAAEMLINHGEQLDHVKMRLLGTVLMTVVDVFRNGDDKLLAKFCVYHAALSLTDGATA